MRKERIQQLTDAQKDEIEAFALQLFRAKKIKDRQFSVWQRVLRGESIQKIFKSQTMSGSRPTLYRELQRAIQVIETAWVETQYGTIRMGITADMGQEPEWKTDKTSLGIQPDQETNYPLPALELYGKKGCVR